MPEEHTYNQPPAAPNPPQNPAPGQSPKTDFGVYPQAHSTESKRPDHSAQAEAFSEFGDGGSKNVMPGVIIWLTFVITVMLTGFFWLTDYSNVKAISEKENEKNQIVSQLNSKSNKEVEETANNFKLAFNQLNDLASNNVSKSTMLSELYSHFTKDAKISTIAVSKEGGLSIDGATGSYRQVANFMLGLQGYDKVSNVALKSVAINTEEGIPTNQQVTFSMSADIKLSNLETNASSESTLDAGNAATQASGEAGTSTTATTSASTTTNQ